MRYLPFLILFLSIAGCSTPPTVPLPPRGEGYHFQDQGFVEIYRSDPTEVYLHRREKFYLRPQPVFQKGDSLRGRKFNSHLLPLWKALKKREEKSKEKKNEKK